MILVWKVNGSMTPWLEKQWDILRFQWDILRFQWVIHKIFMRLIQM